MAWKDKRGLLNPENEKNPDGSDKEDDGEGKGNGDMNKTEIILSEMLVDDDRGLQRRHLVDTTLLVHFFGPKGKREIRYEDFKKYDKHILHIFLRKIASKRYLKIFF